MMKHVSCQTKKIQHELSSKSIKFGNITYIVEFCKHCEKTMSIKKEKNEE